MEEIVRPKQSYLRDVNRQHRRLEDQQVSGPSALGFKQRLTETM